MGKVDLGKTNRKVIGLRWDLLLSITGELAVLARHASDKSSPLECLFLSPQFLLPFEREFVNNLHHNYLKQNAMQSARPLVIRSQLSQRLFSSGPLLRAAPPFASGPAPPRLPKEDQELYEQLQRSSTGAFSTPKPTIVISQSPAATSDASKRSMPRINQSPHTEPTAAKPWTGQKLENVNAKVEAKGNGEELHPDVRRGVLPEFEGERNPKTGESGGPKNEPLRWGGGVDWSYNGRVTDF